MKYEGWANYHTWNVALWINNDKPMYDETIRYVSATKKPTYEGLLDYVQENWGDITSDGVSWTDPTLDRRELDDMLREMKG